MSQDASPSSRRRFIRIATTGLAAAPFVNAVFSGTAHAVDKVKESDPQAAALKYKEDATKAPERKDASATCANCNFYSGKAGEADGPCALFGGKLVAAKGWCTAWVKKA